MKTMTYHDKLSLSPDVSSPTMREDNARQQIAAADLHLKLLHREFTAGPQDVAARQALEDAEQAIILVCQQHERSFGEPQHSMRTRKISRWLTRWLGQEA